MRTDPTLEQCRTAITDLYWLWKWYRDAYPEAQPPVDLVKFTGPSDVAGRAFHCINFPPDDAPAADPKREQKIEALVDDAINCASSNGVNDLRQYVIDHFAALSDADLDQCMSDAGVELDEPAGCKEGMHTWIDTVGLLAPDTPCALCDETYGDPK